MEAKFSIFLDPNTITMTVFSSSGTKMVTLWRTHGFFWHYLL